VGSSPSRSDNVIKETGVFQTYSIAFSRFSNFHREFSNFPIAFCNVFSKINLINKNIFSQSITPNLNFPYNLEYFAIREFPRSNKNSEMYTCSAILRSLLVSRLILYGFHTTEFYWIALKNERIRQKIQ
jgi:hypothetical protein